MYQECKLVVCIPARNEEERIGECLHALCGQTVTIDAIVLFLNNCTDSTAEICRSFATGTRWVVVEEMLTGHLASAGEARRRALWHAAARFPHAAILTTDADTRPPMDWVEKNLRAVAAGADVVCGQAELFADDAARIKPELHLDDRRETFLLTLLDEIDAALNPEPHDPWPRHTQESGASICLKPGVLGRIGGAPRVASGEDRALIDRCRMIDLKIRHDPTIIMPVSGRLEGRAAGGMAETIKRRMQIQDEFADARLEPVMTAYRRSLAKAQFRACWNGVAPSERLTADLLFNQTLMSSLLACPFFGAAWDVVQARSPVLRRRPLAYAALAHETRQALRLHEEICRDPVVEIDAA